MDSRREPYWGHMKTGLIIWEPGEAPGAVGRFRESLLGSPHLWVLLVWGPLQDFLTLGGALGPHKHKDPTL